MSKQLSLFSRIVWVLGALILCGLGVSMIFGASPDPEVSMVSQRILGLAFWTAGIIVGYRGWFLKGEEIFIDIPNFILLLVAVSFLLIFLNVILLGFSASLSCAFMKHEYGVFNLVIMRALAVIASILSGFLVAFPMGYLTRKKSVLYGFAMPLIGLILIFQPWKHERLQLIIQAYPEWIALFLSCGFFWYLGYKTRNKKIKTNS